MEETQPPRPRLARRLARRVRLPRLSGKATAAWLVVCLLLPAVLIPTVVQLPIWIRFEIVLGVWWVVWLLVLARLLYTGQRVSDDHVLGAPRSWLASSTDKEKEKPAPARGEGGGSWFSGLNLGGGMDGEVAAIGCAIVIGLILLFAGAWILVEIAIPVTWFLLYFLVRGMLATVVNDRHRCRGQVGRSLGWAFLWATAYMAPLALAIWFIHYALTQRAGA
jgi:hypothetical protein